MIESAAPVPCPDGHGNTGKLLSTVSLATGGDGAAVAAERATAADPAT